MKETLYRTKNPEKLLWMEKCFELTLGEETIDDQLGYFVRETECWWDSANKRAVRVQYTLSPRGGFPTVEEAQERYQVQRILRAKWGFIHSFAPSYQSTKAHKYTLVEVPAEATDENVAVPPVECSPIPAPES